MLVMGKISIIESFPGGDEKKKRKDSKIVTSTDMKNRCVTGE